MAKIHCVTLRGDVWDEIDHTGVKVNYVIKPIKQRSEFPFRIRVLTPIIHPAVGTNIGYGPKHESFFGVGMVYGKSHEDVLKQLTCIDIARRSPIDIDASVLYKKDRYKFISVNSNLINFIRYGAHCKHCLGELRSTSLDPLQLLTWDWDDYGEEITHLACEMMHC